MLESAKCHQQFKDFLKDEALPKLTNLLHDLRQVKAKLESVEKNSRKQFQQKVDDVIKARKKGIQSAIDQATQSLTLAQNEHQKTMAGVMGMFEKYERNRLNVLKEIFIRSAEVEKLLMTEVSDANFTVESCYLATNVEADITELIMLLHQKKLWEKQQQHEEVVPEIKPVEEDIKSSDDDEEDKEDVVKEEEQKKRRIPVEINDADVNSLQYSKLNEIIPDMEIITPCDLKGWNLKTNNINLISYITLIYSYDYKIPDDKIDLFTKLANACGVSPELSEKIISHPIDNHSHLTLSSLIELMKKYTFADFNDDTVNYRLWLRSHLSLLFTSLLWYIKQGDQPIDVKSKQLLTLRKHGKDIQILLSDEEPERIFYNIVESNISWCLEYVLPILEDCEKIISTLIAVPLPIPVPISNLLFENILNISLCDENLINDFKQIVSLLDLFSTVIDVNDHLSFVAIFKSLLNTYLSQKPRSDDIFMRIEEISNKIIELAKEVVDPSILEKTYCIYIYIIVFTYLLSPEAYIVITKTYIKSIVDKAIRALNKHFEMFYKVYINDNESIKNDVKLYQMLYSIQILFSDNYDPLLNPEDETKQILTDTIIIGVNNIYNSLCVDENNTPVDLSITMSKILEFIKSPDMKQLFDAMKVIKEDIDTFTYESIRTITKEQVKEKYEILIKQNELNYEVLSVYHSAYEFDKEMTEIMKDENKMHETLSSYLNEWLSNIAKIIIKDIEESLKTEEWTAEKGETDRYNPSSSSEKLVLSITTMLDSMISKLEGEFLPNTCTKLFVKQIVDIISKYSQLLMKGNDDFNTIIPQPPQPPQPVKSSGWKLKSFFGGNRRTSDTGVQPYNIDALCVKVNSFYFVKSQIDSIHGSISKVVSPEGESVHNESFENLNKKLVEYEEKLLKYVGYYIPYVGLRSLLLDSLYNPNYDTNTLEIVLSGNMKTLTHPFEVLETTYTSQIRIHLFEAIVSVICRVLCCSGRTMTKAASTWEYNYPEKNEIGEYPPEISKIIEDALANGSATIKTEFNESELFFDLCAMTVTNNKTGSVGNIKLSYKSKIASDIEYLKKIFIDVQDDKLGGVDESTIENYLEKAEHVLRFVHSSSSVLIHELSENDKYKERIISILKHRIEDPVAVKYCSGK